MKGKGCHTRDELCEDTDCRNWVECIDVGNCVLRIRREYTLEEIGMVLGGITRERVRQIEEKAMRKLKVKLKNEIREKKFDLPFRVRKSNLQ